MSDGNGGWCCDIDIVRNLRTMGYGDAGVLERKDVKLGVTDR